MNMKLGLMGAMLVGGSAVAADGIKLGGFVNPTYSWAKSTPDTNTFGINDAAIYLGKTLGTGEVLIDMPFKTGNGGATDGSLLAGFTQAQAFVQWKYENGFMWKLGQFDSLYGAESNDSADRFFALGGTLLQSLPTVHSGLVIGYDFSDALAFHLLVSNPNDTATMTGGNPDFGVKIAAHTDGMKASVGLLVKRPVGGDAEWLVDVIAGTEMDQISADLEVVIRKGDSAPLKTTNGVTTGLVTGTGGETGFGIGLGAAYGLSEEIKAGLRGEFVKTGDVKVFEIAVGPKFGLSKDFDVGLEYYFEKESEPAVKHTAQHGVVLSAIHRF